VNSCSEGLLHLPSLELDLDRLFRLGCHVDRLPCDQFVHPGFLVPLDRPVIRIQLRRDLIAGLILSGLGQPGLLGPIPLLLRSWLPHLPINTVPPVALCGGTC
jgi:hypothetical protein